MSGQSVGVNINAEDILDFPVRQVSITLTDADIQALPVTGITVVAAPGSNTILACLRATLYTALTTNYTNINASASAGICYDGDLSNPATVALFDDVAAEWGDLTTALTQQSTFVHLQAPGVVPGVAYPVAAQLLVTASDTVVNKPLVFKANNVGDGPFAGGHPDNTMKLSVVYMIVDVS